MSETALQRCSKNCGGKSESSKKIPIFLRNFLAEKTRLQGLLLESQETVFELQKELLECKDGKFQSVEKVLKSEIRL